MDSHVLKDYGGVLVAVPPMGREGSHWALCSLSPLPGPQVSLLQGAPPRALSFLSSHVLSSLTSQPSRGAAASLVAFLHPGRPSVSHLLLNLSSTQLNWDALSLLLWGLCWIHKVEVTKRK